MHSDIRRYLLLELLRRRVPFLFAKLPVSETAERPCLFMRKADDKVSYRSRAKTQQPRWDGGENSEDLKEGFGASLSSPNRSVCVEKGDCVLRDPR